jgi:hypothetical protein
MSHFPDLPEPLRINGRVYYQRHKLEEYKQKLIARALGGESDGEQTTDPPTVIELVPAPQAARELGHSRRTLGRRIAESKPATPSVT